MKSFAVGVRSFCRVRLRLTVKHFQYGRWPNRTVSCEFPGALPPGYAEVGLSPIELYVGDTLLIELVRLGSMFRLVK